MARVRGVAGSTDLAKRAAGGIHLKLEDGESATVCFAGFLATGEDTEPLGVEVVWYEGKNGRRSEEYDPTKHNADAVSVRFLWNVFIKETSEVKVWSQGPKFFRKWLNQKNKNRMGCWFEIERSGTDMDTDYTIAKGDEISDDELEDIKRLDLHDLDRAAFSSDEGATPNKDEKQKRQVRKTSANEAPRTHKPSSTAGNGSGSTAVISAETAKTLRQAIQDMPNSEDVYAKFKNKFGVDKLKDLPAEQETAAVHWLKATGQLSLKTGPEQQTEVDPFE